jgi:quinol monooxygenase YgiN
MSIHALGSEASTATPAIRRTCSKSPPPCYNDCMKNYYALINRLTTKPGKRDEVLKILLEAGKPFQENAACILYLVYEDVQDPNVIWVEDLWASEEEHTAALARPEVRPFVAQALPLLEGMPEQREIAPVGGKGL